MATSVSLNSPSLTRRSSIGSRLSFAVSNVEAEDGLPATSAAHPQIEEEIAEIKRYEVRMHLRILWATLQNANMRAAGLYYNRYRSPRSIAHIRFNEN